MARQLKARACGKFILAGEHVVVNGDCPAIAFPLKNIFCEISGSLGDIRIRSSIPIQKGFGSSAALSIAITRAFKNINKLSFRESKLELAQKIESFFHGRSSGLDITVVAHERPLYFKSLQEFSFISSRISDFVIVDSGPRKNCKEMVEHIQSMRTNASKKWEMEVVGPMNEICTTLRHCLEGGDEQSVAESINWNHLILKKLELSTPRIESILEHARKEGALAGKVSGAGGGGAVALLAKKGEAGYLSSRLKKRGIHVISTN
ncbi:MAG: hypothetical protein HYS98_06875 [Deltaproteobacteria bacterium]|nr:hypothetical protein [Deltaproteobacteria bacterium]